METIRTYIENLFQALPDTEEAWALKIELLQSNEEKFLDLLKRGKNEQEAIGQVLQEFGSLDELRTILGTPDPADSDPQKEAERAQMVENYRVFRKRFALMIAGGIGLIFLGMILQSYFEGLESQVGEMAGFFIPLAMGLGLFIYAGIQNDTYKAYFKQEKMYAYLDEGDIQAMATKGTQEDRETYPLETAFWLIIVAVYLYMGFVKGLWHPGWIIFIIGAAISNLIHGFRDKKII